MEGAPKIIDVEAVDVTNKEVENAEKPKVIEEAESLEELESILDKGTGLQGSEEFFDPAKLKEIIGRVKSGELGLEYVTRTDGLREKVAQLLGIQETDKEEAVERNGSSDPAVHAYTDAAFDTMVAAQPDAYSLRNQRLEPEDAEFVEEKSEEKAGESPEESAEESAEEAPLDFEAIGRARLERIAARASEAQEQVQGYGKSLWEKAKDYTVKGAKAIGTGVKKAFYMTFAAPEMIDAAGTFVGEKYASLIEAGNSKYKEIADKVTGAKEAFLNRIKAAQERRQERRDRIAQAKADIADAKARLKAARWDLKSKFAVI